MKKLPQFMVLAGSEDFLVSREKTRMTQAAWANGYRVLWPSDSAEAESEIAQAEILAVEPLLLIQTWLPDFNGVPDNVSVLTVLAGQDTLPEGLPRNVKTAVYSRGTTRRDRRQAAERFAAQEAKRHGLTLSDKLAEALVNLTGDDLGIVAWELYKLAAYHRASGLGPEINQESVTATIRVAVTMPETSALVEALAARDGVRLGRVLARFTGGDSSMLLLRGKGGPADAVSLWLRLSEAEPGLDAESLAGLFGVPVWQVKNRDLPAVRRWGRTSLRRLLKSMAELERAILEGRAVSPWVSCQALLLSAVSMGDIENARTAT